MSQVWTPRGVKVKGYSKAQLRAFATKVRQLSSKTENKPLDVIHLLEVVLQELGLKIFVLDQSEMGSIEASTDPDAMSMIIRSDVYDDLHSNNGRARFTIAHEIGHLLLHENIALSRDQVAPKPYEDSEWQADTFAAEILVPLSVAANYREHDYQELATVMQVSYTCARNRISEAQKMKKPTLLD